MLNDNQANAFMEVQNCDMYRPFLAKRYHCRCRTGDFREDLTATPEGPLEAHCPNCEGRWQVLEVLGELRMVRREVAVVHLEWIKGLAQLSQEVLMLAREQHLHTFVERVLGETSKKKRHETLKSLVAQPVVSFARFSALGGDELATLVAGHFTVDALPCILRGLQVDDPELMVLLGEIQGLQLALLESEHLMLDTGKRLSPQTLQEYRGLTPPWEVDLRRPDGLRPELLAHPQIPKALHGMNPRTVMGRKWWDEQRFAAYRKRDDCCHACGVHKSQARLSPSLDAHEIYRFDYAEGWLELKEVVALCKPCHEFIHAGGMYNRYRKGEVSLTDLRMVLKRGFRVLKEANLPPFFATMEVYALVLEELDHPQAGVVRALALKLEAEFAAYTGDHPIPWGQWHVVIDGRKHHSKFKDQRDWAMHYGKLQGK